MRRERARGFTLFEMMTVVIIIAILAVLAIPSSSDARYDRHVYEDAGSIAELFRQARARALSRGAAVMVYATTGTGNIGTFVMYDSVMPGTYVPINTCHSPSTWNLSTASLTTTTNGMAASGAVNMNGQIEQQAGITTTFNSFTNAAGTATSQTSFAICYSPLGQAFLSLGASGSVVFDGAPPMTGSVNITVSRSVTGISGTNTLGIARTVVIPPNGMARVTVAAASG